MEDGLDGLTRLPYAALRCTALLPAFVIYLPTHPTTQLLQIACWSVIRLASPVYADACARVCSEGGHSRHKFHGVQVGIRQDRMTEDERVHDDGHDHDHDVMGKSRNVT